MRRLPLIIGLLCLTGCSNGASTLTLHAPNDAATLEVQVEIADSDEERIGGLMHRTELADTSGMLFVFPAPDTLSFWMRDTNLALDIIYFDADGNYVNAHTMEPCLDTTDSCPTYPSAALARYALEVNKGYREEHNIGVGWFIDPAEVAAMSDPT